MADVIADGHEITVLDSRIGSTPRNVEIRGVNVELKLSTFRFNEVEIAAGEPVLVRHLGGNYRVIYMGLDPNLNVVLKEARTEEYPMASTGSEYIVIMRSTMNSLMNSYLLWKEREQRRGLYA